MTDMTADTDRVALQEPWPNYELQRQGVGVGMWLFLMSEVLFFAGLFITYAIYRGFNASAFRTAAAETDIVYGATNTLILLTSSFTMTVALRAATAHLRRLAVTCLVVTALLGTAFLIVKGLEYHDDWTKSLVPGVAGYPLSPPPTQLFWTLYWVMTGIHAIHLTAGILLLLTVAVLFHRGTLPVQGSTAEGLAIYWHFVDCVWVMLFPLLYLVGRS